MRLLLALLLVGAIGSADAIELSDLVKKHRRSVVFVKAEKVNQQTGAVTESHGTGFIVNGDGYVITSGHVVSGAPGAEVDIRAATGSREGALEGMDIIYENTSLDVALLKFRNTVLSREAVPVGDPWSVGAAATVYAMGFPGKEEWFHTEGKLSGSGPKGSWNTTLILNPGMSGGPVFNTDGKVVAMAWGGVPTAGINGINRVLPINLLADALRMAGIEKSQLAMLSAEQGIEVKHRIDKVQESQNQVVPVSKAYELAFQAEPGYKIVEYRWVPNSANNSTTPLFETTPDKKAVAAKFSLTSGPIFDRWRGWLDGVLLTRQVKEREQN